MHNVLLTAAHEQKLRTRGGDVYAQTHPCTYVRLESCAAFINRTLRGDPVYTAHPRRFDALLKQCNAGRLLPRLTVDRNLLAFEDGVLLLRECEFVPYGTPCLHDKIARHHIAIAFQRTVNLGTPLFDRVVRRQLSEGDYEALLQMMGRMFFQVGELDEWRVVPFLYGASGTGKSTVMNVVRAMFAPSAVSVNAYDPDKELILTTGARAKQLVCPVPMLGASNDVPAADAERLRLFHFGRPVPATESDPTLQNRIESGELAALVQKCVRAYLTAAAASPTYGCLKKQSIE